MEIVRLCPFSVTTVAWGERPGAWRLTIAVKATFSLVHGGEATLAPRQDSAHGDISWDHNPQASPFAPSDFVPFKQRIDVVLSGRAYAPEGVPTEHLVARFRVGELEKALRVCGPRVWMQGATGMRPSAPERFVSVPLRYELAATRGENLGGIQISGAGVGSPLPRIDCWVDQDSASTPGFGPLPVGWRAQLLGVSPDVLTFVRRLRTAHAVAPPALPASLFNFAPSDQQIDTLAPGSLITLENLHRKIPRFASRLPRIRPRAFYAPRGSSHHDEVDLRCDTLWIDALRMVAVVSWRGCIPVESPEEHALGRIVVGAESPEITMSPEDLEGAIGAPEESSPRPVVPRPYEGEVPEDEGYTLLPSRPAREAPIGIEGDAPQGRAPSGAPPRDSTIPASGERPIEDRDSRVVVTGPGMPDAASPVAQGHSGALGADTEIPLPAPPPRWTNDEPWAHEAAPPAPLPACSAPTVPVDEPTPNPGTTRAGSAPPPPDARHDSSVPPPPATRRAGASDLPLLGFDRTPAPPELATVDHDHDAPPATQRAPALEAMALFARVQKDEPPPATLRPSAMAVEPVRLRAESERVAPASPLRASGASRQLSTPNFAAAAFTLADLPIEECAALSARLDREPHERARILAEYGMSEVTWASTARSWASAVRSEMEQGRCDLLAAYDTAYVDRLELDRGSRMDAADYARLVVSIERPEADRVLEEMGLPRASLVRIERVWARRMLEEPTFGARVRQAVLSQRRAASRAQTVIRSPGGESGDVRVSAGDAHAPSRPRSGDR